MRNTAKHPIINDSPQYLQTIHVSVILRTGNNKTNKSNISNNNPASDAGAEDL